MKNFSLIFIFNLLLFACRPPMANTDPVKPGSHVDCLGPGCKADFSVRIDAEGHVNIDNIDEKFRDPTAQKPPTGDVSMIDWLRGLFSPGSLVDKPADGGAGGSNGSGNSDGEGGTGSGTDGQGTGTPGPVVENPLPGANPGDDPCVNNPSACTETPRETHFENSELGKLLNFTWKGLNYSFGEISGQNNKKRREAQALNRRYAEMEVLRDQVTAVVDDMNTATDSVLAVAGDLSKGDRYNLTGEAFGQIKNAVAVHNRRATALDQDTGDIPEKVVIPPGKPIYDTPELKSVEQARQYRNYVSRQVEAGPESFKPIGRQLIGVADSALDYSEVAYRAGDKEKGDFAKEMAITALDMALSLTPGVGLVKDIYEAASGKSLLTGKPLSGFERTMAFVGVVTAGYGSALKIAGKAAIVSDIFKAGKAAEEAAEVTRATSKATEIAEAAAKAGVKDKAVIDEVAEFMKDGLPCVASHETHTILYEFLGLIESKAYAADCIPGSVEKSVKNAFEAASELKSKFNGNVPWASTAKAPDGGVNAAKHWIKHGGEFSEIKSASEYVDKASGFAKNPPTGSLSKSARNGSDKVLYHAESNTLLIHNSEMVPSTMYRPNPSVHGYPTNLDFFNNHPF